MKVSKKTEYGLRALIFLAKKKGKIFSAREIAQKAHIPFYFLGKLLSLFQKRGLIKADKGRKGVIFFSKTQVE